MAIVAATVLASCGSTNDEPASSNEPVAIRLASSLSVATRTAFERNVPSQFEPNERGYAYVFYDASPGTVFIDNGEANELRADNLGNFIQTNQMYFPQVDNVNIFASFPIAAKPDEQTTFAVRSLQKTKDDYLQSDLLYAGKMGVQKTASTVNLTFYHLLTKITIALKAGTGLSSTDIDAATVRIEGGKRAAHFTPANAQVNSAASAGTLTPVAGSEGAITVGSSNSTDFSAKNDAIIIPQSLTAGAPFIKVILASGGELVYSVPSGGLTFVAGSHYTYNVTVNCTALVVSSNIMPWITYGITYGTANN